MDLKDILNPCEDTTPARNSQEVPNRHQDGIEVPRGFLTPPDIYFMNSRDKGVPSSRQSASVTSAVNIHTSHHTISLTGEESRNDKRRRSTTSSHESSKFINLTEGGFRSNKKITKTTGVTPRTSTELLDLTDENIQTIHQDGMWASRPNSQETVRGFPNPTRSHGTNSSFNDFTAQATATPPTDISAAEASPEFNHGGQQVYYLGDSLGQSQFPPLAATHSGSFEQFAQAIDLDRTITPYAADAFDEEQAEVVRDLAKRRAKAATAAEKTAEIFAEGNRRVEKFKKDEIARFAAERKAGRMIAAEKRKAIKAEAIKEARMAKRQGKVTGEKQREVETKEKDEEQLEFKREVATQQSIERDALMVIAAGEYAARMAEKEER